MMSATEALEGKMIVLSDLHANAGATKAALKAAREEGFDRLIILGDLLTYGPGPAEVLDLVSDAVARDRAILVRGNHDQLYIDLAKADDRYYRTLPDWLRETVDWTRRQVAGNDLENMFNWHHALEAGPFFLAHANPFPYGDWSYMNEPDAFQRAAQELQRQGKAVGIFAHTHRPGFVRLGGTEMDEIDLRQPSPGEVIESQVPSGGDIVLIDTGSVGQPRDRARRSMFFVLEHKATDFRAAYRPVDYDVEDYLGALHRSGLSEETTARLAGYVA